MVWQDLGRHCISKVNWSDRSEVRLFFTFLQFKATDRNALNLCQLESEAQQKVQASLWCVQAFEKMLGFSRGNYS